MQQDSLDCRIVRGSVRSSGTSDYTGYAVHRPVTGRLTNTSTTLPSDSPGLPSGAADAVCARPRLPRSRLDELLRKIRSSSRG